MRFTKTGYHLLWYSDKQYYLRKDHLHKLNLDILPANYMYIQSNSAKDKGKNWRLLLLTYRARKLELSFLQSLGKTSVGRLFICISAKLNIDKECDYQQDANIR